MLPAVESENVLFAAQDVFVFFISSKLQCFRILLVVMGKTLETTPCMVASSL